MSDTVAISLLICFAILCVLILRSVVIPRRLSLYISPSIHDEWDGKPPRFSLMKAIGCQHEKTKVWAWCDYRSGSGWMSDSYEADICTRCGRAVEVRKTY